MGRACKCQSVIKNYLSNSCDYILNPINAIPIMNKYKIPEKNIKINRREDSEKYK